MQRLRLLEEKLKEDPHKGGIAYDYRETLDIALRAGKAVTDSGYTRLKAVAKAVDSVNKTKKRTPGFIAREKPAEKA
jgi:hypothetical protein